MLRPGLYEQVINTALNRELLEIPDARKSVAPIDKAEASKVLAQYLADVVQKGLENVVDNGGDISTQISLANQIVDLIQNTTQEADFAALTVTQRAEQLLALLQEQDPRLAVGKTAADLRRPETSIAQSSLFTGAIHEPQMYTELKKEIVSADRIRHAGPCVGGDHAGYLHPHHRRHAQRSCSQDRPRPGQRGGGGCSRGGAESDHRLPAGREAHPKTRNRLYL